MCICAIYHLDGATGRSLKPPNHQLTAAAVGCSKQQQVTNKNTRARRRRRRRRRERCIAIVQLEQQKPSPTHSQPPPPHPFAAVSQTSSIRRDRPVRPCSEKPTGIEPHTTCAQCFESTAQTTKHTHAHSHTHSRQVHINPCVCVCVRATVFIVPSTPGTRACACPRMCERAFGGAKVQASPHRILRACERFVEAFCRLMLATEL